MISKGGASHGGEAYPAEDGGEKMNRKGERADGHREDLDQGDGEKDEGENRIQPAGGFVLVGLVAEEIHHDHLRSCKFEYDDRPGTERDEREGDGAVEVGVVRTNQRALQMEVPVDVVTPPHRADSRNKSHPVMKKDEDEERD